MKIFGFEISRSSSKPAKTIRNNYAGARNDRTTTDWLTNNLTADEILRWHLRKLRERSRDLAMNNDHMKNFLRKLKVNVIGHKGIGMQSKIRLKNGDLDKTYNIRVEDAWKKFSKKKNASVCGTLSLKAQLDLVMDSVARDGEVLIRKVKGYDNDFRFSLQVLESDFLDETLNRDLPNGNIIRMGIEKNPWGKPVAYHLFSTHPGERLIGTNLGMRYIRIPAEEIIHVFVKERPSQSRGVPWAHTALIRLRMLGAYEEAALVNARIGASQMGWIIDAEDGSGTDPDEYDTDGNEVIEVEPGIFRKLRYGSDVKDFKPVYPNGELVTFEKAMLRGIAAGMGSNYNSLASDLEGVNFSSLRSGAIEERDNYKVIQQWIIEQVIDDIFPDFLEMAILTGQLRAGFADLERLNSPTWQPRTWDWVDPLKDVNARTEELAAGLNSKTRICAEKGVDFEDIVEDLKEEKRLLDEAGIILPDLMITRSGKAVPDPATEPPASDPNNFMEHEYKSVGGNGNGRK